MLNTIPLIQVCTRSSPKHPFHVSYPVAVGAPNCALDVAGSPVNQAQRKPHSSCTTRLLWTGGIEMPPQQAEQVCYDYCMLQPIE